VIWRLLQIASKHNLPSYANMRFPCWITLAFSWKSTKLLISEVNHITGTKQSKCVKMCHTTESSMLESSTMNYTNRYHHKRIWSSSNICRLICGIWRFVGCRIWDSCTLLHLASAYRPVVRLCKIIKTWLCTPIKCGHINTTSSFVDFSTNVLWSMDGNKFTIFLRIVVSELS
jgi:hypothetical protein